MFEERDPQGDKQNEFWLVRDQLPQATVGTFYRKLNETLARTCDDERQEKMGESLPADEGYFSVEEVCCLRAEGIRTLMGDPHAPRQNPDRQCKMTKQVLRKARFAVESKSGKALLRKRGEHLERSFAHVLDQGGLRRATLRGKENLTKRQIAAAMVYDLSLLMRKVFGYGTPKQWLAQGLLAAATYWMILIRRCRSLVSSLSAVWGNYGSILRCLAAVPSLANATRENRCNSTGC